MKPPPAHSARSIHIPLMNLQAQYAGLVTPIKNAIQSVIKTSNFTLGPEVEKFENEFARYLGVKHVVGVSSGTAAIYLALKALGVKPGDEVITTPFTFIATVEAIRHVGAVPIFVDIDPTTLCLNPNLLRKAIRRKTKGIVVVHIHGHPARMDSILKIAKEYKLWVVEDAAQAQGARFKGKMVGGIGQVGCFSFFPSKNLGAFGDAGAVVTNQKEIAKKIALLRDHGRVNKYRHVIEGFNFRLSALQAAVLRVKLPHLNDWNQRRRAIAVHYTRKLNTFVEVPRIEADVLPVFHQYVIRTTSRKALQKFLHKKGIDIGIHYPIPLHLQPCLRNLKYKRGMFPVAEKMARQVLSLPMFPELTQRQINSVVSAIKTFKAAFE